MNVRTWAACALMASLCAWASLLVACGTRISEAGREELIFDRARFDLDCPRNELHVRAIRRMHSYGVTGCGVRATYVLNNCTEHGTVRSCQARLNSSTDHHIETESTPTQQNVPSNPALNH